jgi:Tol biopolymer transport system component
VSWTWKSAVLGVVAVACLSLPAAAVAVFPGPNGDIAFVSGRGVGGDASSDVYILDGPGDTSPTQLTSAAGQHRHPAYSPDRTKLVYALWNGTDQDLWIHDLEDNSRSRLTLSGSIDEDRPSWSPDGTKIAYETELTDGSNQEDILIADATTLGGDTALNLTSSPGVVENKPVWSPDGSTIYYSFAGSNGTDDADIYREPSNNSDLTVDADNQVLAGTTNEFQPSLSPDGAELCFTEAPAGAFNSATNNNANVVKVASTGAGTQTEISTTANAIGDYNCTWSPDGTKIAFVTGTFNNGALVMRNSDDTGDTEPVVNNAGGVFDGNPDWTFNPPPACTDVTREIETGQRVTVPLACTDPDEEELTYSIVAPPANGELGPVDQDNGTVEYVHDVGFIGTDTFTFKANDGTTDSNTATASITVEAPICKGRPATIAGGLANDSITGTPGADVIAALAGNDKVKAAGGNDIVCGGDGDDTLKGNGGKDKLFGEAGKDKLKGGGGKDRCVGAAGKDKAKGDCEKRKSI